MSSLVQYLNISGDRLVAPSRREVFEQCWQPLTASVLRRSSGTSVFSKQQAFEGKVAVHSASQLLEQLGLAVKRRGSNACRRSATTQFPAPVRNCSLERMSNSRSILSDLRRWQAGGSNEPIDLTTRIGVADDAAYAFQAASLIGSTFVARLTLSVRENYCQRVAACCFLQRRSYAQRSCNHIKSNSRVDVVT